MACVPAASMPRPPILRRPSMIGVPAGSYQRAGIVPNVGDGIHAVAAVGFAAASPVSRPAWRASCPVCGGILPPKKNRSPSATSAL
ncbi:hypothetical protein LF1_08910 [Rubripirellula obstinata]|uniref:Uncharacterized protein n=1 Tax=Rubripirellula obstinata TaxID=406547 RepID=A0A5B1CDU7_9BACT|nr:hypothetical protein LF1_08910 [Rubripirellula obstinata]